VRSRARRIDSTGAGFVPRTSGYSVRVVYTEPEFQRRTPAAPDEFSFTYSAIAARSPEEAMRRALQDFRETAWLSRVGWRRCVERVTVLDGSTVALELAGDDLSRDS
jgi:hypothetical protein